jgi:integrase/DNA-binding XRE family transcriptional regulator
LTTAKVIAFREKIVTRERERGTSGDKAADLVKILGAILADAQQRNLVAQNVVRMLVKKTGGDRHKRKLEVGVDIPTPDEIRKINAQLNTPKFVRWRAILLTFIFTGLRASEVRGLRKSDVDLDKGELHVRQRADAFKKMGAPKTRGSHRTVPLIPTLIKFLREHMLSVPKTDQNLVFPTRHGDVVDDGTITDRGLKPVQVAAGIVKPNSISTRHPKGKAKYSLHKLRHFYASWSINRKIDNGLELPIKVVSERLGHSSIRMTADTYGHLFPRGDDQAELAVADAMFFGNVPAPRPATAAVIPMLKPVDNIVPVPAPLPVLLPSVNATALPAVDDPVPAIGSASPRERAGVAIRAYANLDNPAIAKKIGVSLQTVNRVRPATRRSEVLFVPPAAQPAVAPPLPRRLAERPAALTAHPTVPNRTALGQFMPGPQHTDLMERVKEGVLANQSASCDVLAKQLGTSRTTVKRAKRELGLPDPRIARAAYVKAAVLANPHMLLEKLAKQVGVSQSTVKRIRQEHKKELKG